MNPKKKRLTMLKSWHGADGHISRQHRGAADTALDWGTASNCQNVDVKSNVQGGALAVIVDATSDVGADDDDANGPTNTVLAAEMTLVWCESAGCSKGQYQTSQKTCAACGANQYQPTAEYEGATCLAQPYCARGQKMSPDTKLAKRTCTTCAAGQYQDSSSYRGATCKTQPSCGSGEKISSASTTSKQTCSACSAGQYQDSSSHEETSCKSQPFCTTNQKISAESATTKQRCSACPSGQRQLKSSHRETTCMAECGADQYGDNNGECVPQPYCGIGEKMSPDSSISKRTCSSCPSRTYQSSSRHRAEACLPQPSCVKGSYLPSQRAASKVRNQTCEACPANTYQPQDSFDGTVCRDQATCKAGEYASPTSKTEEQTCLECLPGTYQTLKAHRSEKCLKQPESICRKGQYMTDITLTTKGVCKNDLPCGEDQTYERVLGATRVCNECPAGSAQPKASHFETFCSTKVRCDSPKRDPASGSFTDEFTCNGRGTALENGECECLLGSTGCQCQCTTGTKTDGTCFACAQGYAGPDQGCQFSDKDTCSGRGAAQDDGTCKNCAETGSAGAYCEFTDEEYCCGFASVDDEGRCGICGSGTGGDHCQFSSAISCFGNGIVQDDGSCICDAGFDALTNCRECKGNIASGSNSSEPCNTCVPEMLASSFPECDVATCTRHGQFSSSNNGCECGVGWRGSRCECFDNGAGGDCLDCAADDGGMKYTLSGGECVGASRQRRDAHMLAAATLAVNAQCAVSNCAKETGECAADTEGCAKTIAAKTAPPPGSTLATCVASDAYTKCVADKMPAAEADSVRRARKDQKNQIAAAAGGESWSCASTSTTTTLTPEPTEAPTTTTTTTENPRLVQLREAEEAALVLYNENNAILNASTIARDKIVSEYTKKCSGADDGARSRRGNQTEFACSSFDPTPCYTGICKPCTLGKAKDKRGEVCATSCSECVQYTADCNDDDGDDDGGVDSVDGTTPEVSAIDKKDAECETLRAKKEAAEKAYTRAKTRADNFKAAYASASTAYSEFVATAAATKATCEDLSKPGIDSQTIVLIIALILLLAAQGGARFARQNDQHKVSMTIEVIVFFSILDQITDATYVITEVFQRKSVEAMGVTFCILPVMSMMAYFYFKCYRIATKQNLMWRWSWVKKPFTECPHPYLMYTLVYPVAAAMASALLAMGLFLPLPVEAVVLPLEMGFRVGMRSVEEQLDWAKEKALKWSERSVLGLIPTLILYVGVVVYGIVIMSWYLLLALFLPLIWSIMMVVRTFAILPGVWVWIENQLDYMLRMAKEPTPTGMFTYNFPRESAGCGEDLGVFRLFHPSCDDDTPAKRVPIIDYEAQYLMLSSTLIFEFVFESFPQIIIQIINNFDNEKWAQDEENGCTMLDDAAMARIGWRAFTVISVVLSGFVAFDSLYRQIFQTFVKGEEFGSAASFGVKDGLPPLVTRMEDEKMTTLRKERRTSMKYRAEEQEKKANAAAKSFANSTRVTKGRAAAKGGKTRNGKQSAKTKKTKKETAPPKSFGNPMYQSGTANPMFEMAMYAETSDYGHLDGYMDVEDN